MKPHKGNPTPPKRGEVRGWTPAATRRNKIFLWSVRTAQLFVDDDGVELHGLAFTLTLRDCPASADEWQALRSAFVKRLRRRGLARLHWVTEWQRRRVPHLHGCVWFPVPNDERCDRLAKTIKDSWLAVTAEYGALSGSQYILPIHDARGWFQYMTKHMARGVAHYQRQSESIPEGWRGSTGRMWGKSGEWPTDEPCECQITMYEFHALRRLLRNWRCADARSKGEWRRLSFSRRLLKRGRDRSTVQAVSDDLPETAHRLLLDYVLSVRERRRLVNLYGVGAVQ